MKHKLISKTNVTTEKYDVEHDNGQTFFVTLYIDSESGKWIDESITFEDVELEDDGVEGDIREEILAFLDKNI